MKTINSLNELRQFGINVLTGEACGLGMRLLCDLNEAGKKLVGQFFSAELKLSSNYNSGSICSIMLSRETLLEIAAFALALDCEEVWMCANQVCGWERGELIANEVDTGDKRVAAQKVMGCQRVYMARGDARGGASNRHQMSGRVS